MSQTPALLAGAQRFHAEQFPATIKIGPQSYAAGTSGIRSERDPLAAPLGGSPARRACSFWLPLSAFTDAGHTPPVENTPLTCLAPDACAGEYLIEAVLADPAGVNLTLRCAAPPQ